MHFSKTYAQLLLTLPPELRENAIQYRQLKKLINQVVHELSSLGLSPAVLHELLEQGDAYAVSPSEKGKQKAEDASEGLGSERRHVLAPESSTAAPNHPEYTPKLVYEFDSVSGHIEPRLRFWVNLPASEKRERSSTGQSESYYPSHRRELSKRSLLWLLQSRYASSQHSLSREEQGRIHSVEPSSPSALLPSERQEVIVPLTADSAFFELLSTALQSLSDHLEATRTNFISSLETLSRTISETARPTSHSSTSAASSSSIVPVSTNFLSSNKSDLYSWREIFQLYIDAQVFESLNEANAGERNVDDSEKRLELFAQRVTQKGLGDKRKLRKSSSRKALETFLELNVFIINLKKFQLANAEATRKILKKHAKRTALPLPPVTAEVPSSSGTPSTALVPADVPVSSDTALIPRISTTLPRILVQAIGETVLPIVPHIDDYSCLICTSIAFKPIRLYCGHLFCVRCLVKMQKRGQGDCPMCRAPSVLAADGSNVDWALLNFMQDWFPIETKAKRRSNERESAEEQLREMGIDPGQGCIVA